MLFILTDKCAVVKANTGEMVRPNLFEALTAANNDEFDQESCKSVVKTIVYILCLYCDRYISE